MGKFKLLSLLLGLIFLASCGGVSLKTPEAEDSLVFGYIDMTTVASMDYVNYRQYSPRIEEPFKTFKINGKLFFNWNVKSGVYGVEQFRGYNPWKRVIYRYYFSNTFKRTRFKIKKPGIYFVGAYEVYYEGGFFTAKAKIKELKSPTEKELLQQILPQVKGTIMEERIKKYLKKL